MTGCRHEVTIDGDVLCETCSGTGAKAGTKPKACPQCGGAGQVGTQRGFVMFTTTCPRCRGQGQVVQDPCETCSGRGKTAKRRKVVVQFPAGIDSAQRLRVPGQGMPGPAGTESGDLYVDVEIAPHERFERQGYDLITKERVSFPQATLGTELTLEIPGGTSLTAKVPAGTQPGAVISLRNKGVPHLDRSGRGAVHIVVEVEVPKRLSKNAKRLLEELETELKDEGKPRVEAR